MILYNIATTASSIYYTSPAGIVSQRMEHSYAVSTLEATAVTFSVVCRLSVTEYEKSHLVLAKGNLLEIYSFSEDGLVKMLTTPLFGRITALDTYQPGDLTHDVLFILTERKHFSILCYDAASNSLVTRAKGSLKDQVGRSLDQGQKGVIDPEGRMVGMMLDDALLKVPHLSSLLLDCLSSGASH
jgi:DNA damage-binding protein 1